MLSQLQTQTKEKNVEALNILPKPISNNKAGRQMIAYTDEPLVHTPNKSVHTEIIPRLLQSL